MNECREQFIVEVVNRFCTCFKFGTVGVVAERSADALRVTGLIPARNKYVCDLQVAVPGRSGCLCM